MRPWFQHEQHECSDIQESSPEPSLLGDQKTSGGPAQRDEDAEKQSEEDPTPGGPMEAKSDDYFSASPPPNEPNSPVPIKETKLKIISLFFQKHQKSSEMKSEMKQKKFECIAQIQIFEWME